MSAPSFPVSTDVEDVYVQYQEVKVVDTGRRVVEKDNMSYNPTESNKQPSSNYSFNERDDSGVIPSPIERDGVDKQNFSVSTSQKMYSSSYSQNSVDTEERVQKVSPPRRKAHRDEKSEKLGNWLKNDGSESDLSATSYKPQNVSNFISNRVRSRPYEPEPPTPDGNINEILEVGYNFTLLVRFITLQVFFNVP